MENTYSPPSLILRVCLLAVVVAVMSWTLISGQELTDIIATSLMILLVGIIVWSGLYEIAYDKANMQQQALKYAITAAIGFVLFSLVLLIASVPQLIAKLNEADYFHVVTQSLMLLIICVTTTATCKRTLKRYKQHQSGNLE